MRKLLRLRYVSALVMTTLFSVAYAEKPRCHLLP